MAPEHEAPKSPTNLRILNKWGGTDMGVVRGVPIWNIIKDGTSELVHWVDHPQNPRFSIYDPQNNSNPGNPDTLIDDLVLDKETGLVWPRNAKPFDLCNWANANTRCREFTSGNRCGWRLPTVEELSSLLDMRQANLALPGGHPFLNVQYGDGIFAYWTSTDCEGVSGAAWFVNFWRGAGDSLTGLANKNISGNVWPVRGGIAGISWNC
jgi:hypothetical protein